MTIEKGRLVDIIHSVIYSVGNESDVESLGKNNLLAIAEQRRAILQSEIQRQEEVNSTIEEIASRFPEKPYLPALRPREGFFQPGDKVIVYVHSDPDNPLAGWGTKNYAGDRFVKGVVVDDKRNNSYVSFELEEDVFFPRFRADQGSYSVHYSPAVLHERDFETLASDPGYLEVWLRMIPPTASPFGFDKTLRTEAKKRQQQVA